MQDKEFAEKSWEHNRQALVFRHEAALDFVENGSVLDLGCGDGLMLQLLRDKKGIRGRGIDLSENAARVAAEKGLQVGVFDFSTESLPFGDNSFDTVILLDVLEHLLLPARVLKEARRVCRRHIIIGVPNFNSLPARLQTFFGKVPENNEAKKGHAFWFNLKVLKRMMADNDLEILDIRSNFQGSRWPIIKNIMAALNSVWPSLFGLSFVIKIKK